MYKRQVLVDGTAIDSCIYLGVWAQGKSILTVEGLQEPDGGLSPIQRAFVEEAAVQCGFCTPGIIMSAVEIVGSGKQYTREAVSYTHLQQLPRRKRADFVARSVDFHGVGS